MLKQPIFFILLISLSFTSVSQCCDYTLVMQDSYGDGWNGAEIELFIDEESQGSFSAEDFGTNQVFSTCNDESISLVYSSGEYENENSYLLVAAGGVVVYSDGTAPQTGEIGPFITDCEQEPAPGSSPCTPLPLEVDDCIDVDNSTSIGSGFTPNCSEFDGSDLWFSMVVPESGALVIQTADNGGMNDTAIQLWYGNTCLALESGACDDDGGSGYFSFLIPSNLTPGETIYLQVWGYGGATGSFELCVSDPGIIELEESRLPLFLIDTNGEEIQDEPKIDASLQIIYNGVGELNSLTDDPTEYDGLIGIEIRGATSSGYPQKPYLFETRDALGENNNVSLIDMPAENDWNLISNFNDKVFMRNLLASHLFEQMGEYAPRMRLCEVLLNNSYQGIYAFSEKIKVDNGRVDIATLNVDENEGDDLTGGYILELNYHNEGNSWELNNSPLDHPDFDVHLVYRYPKPDVITVPQKDYIAAYVDSMETALYGPNFMDPDMGYRNYLDTKSFIDYFLINELSRNNDGFKKSRYFHKDKNSNGGLFKAGPIWDFDWGWKDLEACEEFNNQEGAGWAHLINNCPTDNYSPDWYIRLQQDSTYVNLRRCRWEEYKEDFLNETYINNYVDSIADLLQEAQARHFQKWPVLGISTGSPEFEPLPDSFQGEVDFFKSWIALRINWMNENLGGNCPEPVVGTSEIIQNESKIYPNPNTGDFNFLCETCVGKMIEVRNVLGQVVWSEQLNQPNTRISINGRTGLFSISSEGNHLGWVLLQD